MNFTQEQLAKAKAAKSAEELIALAKENGMEMTDDEAKKYFAELHKEGELSDDELNNVSGGCGKEVEDKKVYQFICPFCHTMGQYDLTFYKYSPTLQDPRNCAGCGASVVVFDSTMNAKFTKDGESISVLR